MYLIWEVHCTTSTLKSISNYTVTFYTLSEYFSDNIVSSRDRNFEPLDTPIWYKYKWKSYCSAKLHLHAKLTRQLSIKLLVCYSRYFLLYLAKIKLPLLFKSVERNSKLSDIHHHLKSHSSCCLHIQTHFVETRSVLYSTAIQR